MVRTWMMRTMQMRCKGAKEKAYSTLKEGAYREVISNSKVDGVDEHCARVRGTKSNSYLPAGEAVDKLELWKRFVCRSSCASRWNCE
jgi:hypothetical protein